MFYHESVSDAENDLEVILDGDQTDQIQDINGEENDDNQENNENDTKKVKPKREVKNPQPKLNEQTLKGHRGLIAIENYFNRVKFKGCGHEEQDLNTLLKTYEYWCHRLFPKFPFDSCIARLEKLGTKRATQTQIKKIRMGLMLNDELQQPTLSEEEDDSTRGFINAYNDQFDQLVLNVNESEPAISEEQFARMRQNMERAKHLREEKLKKSKENVQTNALSQMDTCDSENIQFLNDISNNADNNSQRNINEVQLLDENTLYGERSAEDNEDDIENILHYINAENGESSNN